MRNLFLFIAKYYAFFLFLILEGFCIYLITKNKAYHSIYFFNSTNAVTGKIYHTYNDVEEYFYLKTLNDSLLEENARLRSEEWISSFSIDTVNTYLSAELTGMGDSIVKANKIVLVPELVAQDSIPMPDSLFHQIYTYQYAKVINNQFNQLNNYLLLNRGSKHGVEPGMGVITANGIVGKVTQVSNDYARAISMLHKDFRVSGMLTDGTQGTVIWPGDNHQYASLRYISRPVDLQKGDTVVTTNASTFFPEGIMIGTINNYNIMESSNYYDIEIKLSTPFNRLRYVYIVNFLKKEQLEGLNPEDD